MSALVLLLSNNNRQRCSQAEEAASGSRRRFNHAEAEALRHSSEASVVISGSAWAPVPATNNDSGDRHGECARATGASSVRCPRAEAS